MNTLAITLVLISAACHASRDILLKGSKDKQLFIWWMSITFSLLLLPFALYFALQNPPQLPGLIFGLAMGLVHLTYWWAYSHAYDKGDVSHVYPIVRSAPAFVLIFAVLFLGEVVSFTGAAGVLLITAGMYLIQLKGFSWSKLTEPIRAIASDSHTRFAFFALLCVTTYSLLDKVGVSMVDPIVYAFLINVFSVPLFGLYLAKRKKKTDWMMPWRTRPKPLLAASVFNLLNYPLILAALTFTNVSYVTGFRQISVIFVSVVGIFILKEPHGKTRLPAALMIFAGALLISLA